VNPHCYAHLIFDKGTKNIQWKIDSLFNKCCWEKWLSACRKLKLHPCLSPCSSINSKWIKDLNTRSETLKLVQERAENTLEAIGIGKDFLNRTPDHQQLRERIDKWDYMKLKSFCTTKEKVSRGWDVAWWYNACLACTRPWVRFQHQKRKDKKNMKRSLN
jgi:hypothetical protein